MSHDGDVMPVHLCLLLKLKFITRDNINLSSKFNYGSYQLNMNHTLHEVLIKHDFLSSA